MEKCRTCVVVILCFFIAACTAAPIATRLPSNTPTTTENSPLPTLSTIATLPPTNCNVPDLENIDYRQPVYAFLNAQTLMLQQGGEPAVSVGETPNMGTIKSALLKNESLFLLMDMGILEIDLSNCTSAIVQKFTLPVMNGDLVLSPDGLQLFYGTVSSANQISTFGAFDISHRTDRSILTLSESMITWYLIGVSEDGKDLFLLHHGQDPSLGIMLTVDSQTGATTREISFEGWNSLALAPNRLTFATPNQVVNKNDYSLSFKLNVYDLRSSPLTPRVFDLPNPPSEVGYGGLRWSTDSQTLNFLSIDSTYEPKTSYGLWALDVASGKSRQVASVSDPTYYLDGISSDGSWVTVRDDNSNQAVIINLLSGTSTPFSVQWDAILIQTTRISDQ